MKSINKKIKKENEPTYETPMLASGHEMANDLFESGVINIQTMREFDALCLPDVKDLSPKKIKQIRLHEKVSQSVFAKYLNTTLSTIKQWELGKKHPRGTSLKLLNLVKDKGLTVLA